MLLVLGLREASALLRMHFKSFCSHSYGRAGTEWATMVSEGLNTAQVFLVLVTLHNLGAQLLIICCSFNSIVLIKKTGTNSNLGDKGLISPSTSRLQLIITKNSLGRGWRQLTHHIKVKRGGE